MIVNSNTGIKLTKRETKVLIDAMALLRLIEKHGGDGESEAARIASGSIDTALEYLKPEEVAA